MIKSNYWTLLGIAIIMLMTGMTIGDVGEMSSEPHEYTWRLPVTAFSVTGIMFIIGYLSGKTDGED